MEACQPWKPDPVVEPEINFMLIFVGQVLIAFCGSTVSFTGLFISTRIMRIYTRIMVSTLQLKGALILPNQTKDVR